MYQQYRPTQQGMPVVIKNILIINVLFFLASLVFEAKFQVDLSYYLGLHTFSSPLFEPWQILTHMFMHGGLMHIAFNLFMIWMFGSLLEQLWGPKRFLILYFTAGIVAALSQIAIYEYQLFNLENTFEMMKGAAGVTESTLEGIKNQYARVLYTPMVGASGAGYGILVAFATLFPNTLLYLYFAIPVKAKWAVAGLIAIDLFGGLSNGAGDNIAHFAHLGGALVGFLMVKYWNRNNRRSLF